MSSKEKIVETDENSENMLINSNKGELINVPSKQMLNEWQNYLLSSRQSYLIDRGNSLGNEYFSSKQEWDIIFEREWAIVEERMNVGIGVDDEIISMLGKDFFKNQEQLLDELRATMELEEYDVGENNTLTIYTFEDFIMLSNQGIFRDEIFLVDPQRKWKKKVKNILSQYGYDTIEHMVIRGKITLLSQDEKYSSEYWESMVDRGDNFVSAKSMVYYIVMIGIVVQSISFMIQPSNWLIWNALAFIVATNLGAVILAVKAQMSAEDISRKTSQAFNADFYHTIHLFTELKKRFEEESVKDGNTLKGELDSLGSDLYHVAKGYITSYSAHMNTEVDMAESKDIHYTSEEELFE